MELNSALVYKLIKHNFLRGRLRDALEKANPIAIKFCIDNYENNLTSWSQFLQQFTEEEIAQNGHASYQYARYTLQGRFPMGEMAILTNKGSNAKGGWWHYYTNYVLSGPEYHGLGTHFNQAGKALSDQYKLMELEYGNQ
jgi:hypothetical protein